MLQRGPSWLAAAALAAIALVLIVGTATRSLAAGASSVIVSPNQPTGIDVSGEGKVSIVPDIALVNLGVEARAATVEAARDQAAQSMDAVMKSLAGNGVDKKDIQTRGLTINPEYQNRPVNGQPQITGYIVTNQVVIKVRQLGKVTATIDGAVVAGGNAMRMQSIQFTVDDPTAALKDARDRAMADAKAKADQLARIAGVTVGRPIRISDQVTGIPMPVSGRFEQMRSAAMDMAQTPIEPGQTDIRVVVQATYAIE